MSATHLSERELAARFGVTPRTLQTWRKENIGPDYLIVGKSTVRYRLADVEAYETKQKTTTKEIPMIDPNSDELITALRSIKDMLYETTKRRYLAIEAADAICSAHNIASDAIAKFEEQQLKD